jgi:hypothetical protein
VSEKSQKENGPDMIFKGMNIFVEIYNNGINQSDCVVPILEEKGAIV